MTPLAGKEHAIDTSIFLAKLMGPVLAVMGLVLLINPKRVRQMAREFLEGEALIFLSGVITLPVGLAIVITHNVWVAGWPVIITIFGWVAIFAGIARMTLPGLMKTIGGAMIEKTTLFAVPGGLLTALGAYLSYQGYLG